MAITVLNHEEKRACCHCNEYEREPGTSVVSINEDTEEILFSYQCSNCKGINHITFKLKEVEVRSENGLPYETGGTVENHDEPTLVLKQEEFHFCPKCGMSCDDGTSEEFCISWGEHQGSFTWHCPKCDKDYTFKTEIPK
jgi:hypothetical protein